MDSTNRGIVKILDTIPKFDTYSQYSSSLEKVFHDNSFKNLMKNLHEQKKPEMYSYFNVEEKKIETNSIFQPYGLETKKDEPKKTLFDAEEDNGTKTYDSQEKKNIWRFPIRNIKKKRNNQQLDPFRYNPNYNSIFKNIPSVRIMKPVHEATNSLEKEKEKEKNKINLKKQSAFLTEIGDFAMSSPNIIKGKNYFKSKTISISDRPESSSVKKTDANTEESEDRNNHSLKFDLYLNRKEKKFEVNPKVSYIEPYDYHKIRNNSVDFKKMQGRDDQSFYVLNNLNGPSVGYYDINYNCLDKNIRNISLGNLINKEKNKKYLLKKLWGNYQVTVDYQLIDNNKLSKRLKDINI